VTIRKLTFARSTIALAWNDAPSADLVKTLFGSMPASSVGDPRVTFTVSTGRQAGEMALAMDTIPGDLKGTSGQIAVRLLDLAGFHLADRSRGGLLFRAACLGRAGQAWLFPGNAGSGKSCLALWLISQGFAYRSDEMAFIPAEGQMAQGFFRAIFLKKEAAKLFPQIDQTEWFPVGASAISPEGMLVPPDWDGHGSERPDLPLQRILIPSYQPGGQFALKLLSNTDAALELSRTLVNTRNLPNHGFPDVVRLVRKVPTYHLTFGSFAQIPLSIFEEV
jgi:hypothetical protein